MDKKEPNIFSRILNSFREGLIDLTSDSDETTVEKSSADKFLHGLSAHLLQFIAFPIIATLNSYILYKDYQAYNKKKSGQPIKLTDIALSGLSTLAILTLSVLACTSLIATGATIGQASIGLLTLASAGKCILSITRSLAVLVSHTMINTTNRDDIQLEREFHLNQVITNSLSLVILTSFTALIVAFPPAAFGLGLGFLTVSTAAIASKLSNTSNNSEGSPSIKKSEVSEAEASIEAPQEEGTQQQSQFSLPNSNLTNLKELQSKEREVSTIEALTKSPSSHQTARNQETTAPQDDYPKP